MRFHDLTDDLNEGINDNAIFKAIFMAGGPGSGKSFIAKQTGLAGLGFKVIDSDSAFERYLDDAGLDKRDDDDIASPEGQELRDKARRVTTAKLDHSTDGKLGVVVDGTGRDFNKIKGQKAQLRELGYDCAMIFVNTDLETAQERNIKRGEEGGRTLPPEMAKQFWHDVQGNIGKFQNLFGRNMYIVDNSKESNVQGAMQSVYKRMAEWAAAPHRNPTALAWVFANQK